MAHVLQASTSAFGAAIGTVFSAVVTVLKKVGAFFEVVMIANSRASELEYMNNLSDAELSMKFGIQRDQIVSYVFRDKVF